MRYGYLTHASQVNSLIQQHNSFTAIMYVSVCEQAFPVED